MKKTLAYLTIALMIIGITFAAPSTTWADNKDEKKKGEKAEKTEKAAKSDKADKAENGEKAAKAEKAEKTKGDKDKGEKAAKSEKSKGDKSKGDKEVTVLGEVIDQPCYEGKGGAKGEGHRACALACAKRGNQMAVLENDSNTVYSIAGDYSANNNEKLIPYVSEMVEVKGTVSEKDGKKWITVASIKKAEKK